MTSTLIEELEKAEEGSRELDAKIFWVHFPEYDKTTTPLQHCLPYTTSLDAALKLVPEGWGWSVTQWIQSAGKIVGDAEIWLTEEEEPCSGRAWSPALALCIAALRAREAKEGEG